MKKVISLVLFFLAGLQLYAQTDGISYQAVIIGPNGQEMPGADARGNILPNAAIAIRFTILGANNTVEYQEVQTTNTDQYGRINLMIGSIDPDGFALINWDGTTRNLKVEIDFSGGGSNFTSMSRQELNFVPYAYHRNITARGTLSVDDATDLNGELKVAGPTNLNSTLNVNNNNVTNLSGNLNVNGVTNLNSSLLVQGETNFDDVLKVNNNKESTFSGNLTVASTGTATFNGPTAFNGESIFNGISVNGTSKLNGQVTIRATLAENESAYANYPLLVEGSKQGIAIKVSGSRSSENNYISFWDETSGNMWGRIEGQTSGELWTDPEYLIDFGTKGLQIGLAGVTLGVAGWEVAQAVIGVGAAASSSTACVGFGACVTVPIPAFIISAGANLVLKIANAVVAGANLALTIADEATFTAFKNAQIGVTYSSGSGDYAEWLPKANPAEKFISGDLVGVSNGFITKSTSGADKVMVISANPVVLGNMPQQNKEKDYEKVAFLGQVPVKVLGIVEPGDYILPSEIGSGFGKGIHPDDMKITDYKKIAGVAWSVSGGGSLNYVKCAVGLNTNDINNVVLKQEERIKGLESEISILKQQYNQTNDIMCRLIPGFNEALNNSSATPVENNTKSEVKRAANDTQSASIQSSDEDKIIYFDIPRELLKAGIDQARNTYLQTGKSIEEHPFWKKMDAEPAYQEEILQLIETKLEESINSNKTINKEFSKTVIPVKK